MNPTKFPPLEKFTAIDFETAHAQNWSICQVGLVTVEYGKITNEIDLLIQPPGNHYHWGNSRVHGIKRQTTKDAAFFSEIWDQIEPFIANQNIVAHNASFDCSCLRSVLTYYELPVPEFSAHCTVKIYKRNLKFLCDLYGIEINHHHALSDAKACAHLFMMHLNDEKKSIKI